MKILIISSGVIPVFPPSYGGLEEVCGNLAFSLDALGHEVTVVAPSESNINQFGNIKLFDCGPCNPNAHEFEKNAYEKYKGNLSEFDMVHDHTWRKYVYLAKMENPKLNVISTLHGMLPYRIPPPIPKPCMVGLSKDHADRISAGLGINVKHVYNGINLDKYKFNGKDSRNDRFLFLGRMTAFKGAHVFIDLVKGIKAKGDLVGDDILVEDKAYVERLMDACNEYPDIKYWGGVTREMTSEFFQKAKCYVMPCTPGWEEPFGLTVVEAMASGCPVVATPSGAIPELIEHGKTGYLVNYLADMDKFLYDEYLDRIKAEDCRKRAEMFNKENMTTKYLELYGQVLEGGW